MVAVEGYVDVIAMVNAGYEGAVAPLGTALTEDQLALIWKMADEPILCFDGDGAGRRARLSGRRHRAAAGAARQEPAVCEPAGRPGSRRPRGAPAGARRSTRSSRRARPLARPAVDAGDRSR